MSDKQTEKKWQAHVVDDLGFVLGDGDSDVSIEDLLENLDNPGWIENACGDCHPHRIVVVTGSAAVQPQSPDSEFRRLPSRWAGVDRIEFDLEDADSEQALRLWVGAKGMAASLNGEVDHLRWELGEAQARANRYQEERGQLRSKIFRLTAPMMYATDGSTSSALRFIEEYVGRLEREIDDLKGVGR